MFRLAGIGLGLSGLWFAVVVMTLGTAETLPATGQVAYITAPTRSRGGQIQVIDVDRHFNHSLFTLPMGVNGVVFSPDSRQMAFVIQRSDETTRLYVSDINGR